MRDLEGQGSVLLLDENVMVQCFYDALLTAQSPSSSA